MIRAIWLLVINLYNLQRSVMRKLARSLVGRFKTRPRRFVKLELPPGLALAGQPRKLGPIVIGHSDRGPWWDFKALLERIAKDPDVEGVYFRIDNHAGGLAEVAALADQLATLRAAGKRVLCHFDQAMLKDYLLASAADTVMMTPPGRLYTFGMRMEMTFLGDAFARFGIDARFIHLGQFKTAMHRFTRNRMSRSQRRGSRQLLEGLAQSAFQRIANARHISLDEAYDLLDVAPISARDARRHHLIDRAVYADDVKQSIEDEHDCQRPVELLSTHAYLRASREPFHWTPVLPRKRSVAVISFQGMIMMGNEGLPLALRNVITPKPAIDLLERLRKDRTVAAVVVHIDSPGGSALASDLIWRQLRKLSEHKPTVAFLGNVAASGGYYIAVGASQIVALPESLTGSIGVIAGKLSGGALLEKLGVHTEALTLGKTADFTSLLAPLGDTELHNLQRDIRAFYRRFLQRVAASRNLEKRTLHRLARGRVYTGRRAHTIGLVDHVGDLDLAIDLACQQAHLNRANTPVHFVDPDKRSWRSLLKTPSPAAARFDVDAADPPSLTHASAAELVPDALEGPLAAAALLKSGAVLALWPFLTTCET